MLFANEKSGSVTYPSAHQRRSLLKRHRIRQLDRIRRIRNHILSQTPIILKSSQRRILAKPNVVTPLFSQRSLTLLASSTSVPEQQSSNAVTDFPAVDLGSHSNDCAHGLVTGGDGSFGFVDAFEDLVVCVAVACGSDFEEQIIWSGFRGVDVVQLVGCVVLQTLSVPMSGK